MGNHSINRFVWAKNTLATQTGIIHNQIYLFRDSMTKHNPEQIPHLMTLEALQDPLIAFIIRKSRK